MGTERGLDWRVQGGDGATPEVFTNIGGEISFDWKRTSEEIDESTKDDGVYGSSTYGQQKITISVSGNVKLPDAALEAFSTAAKANPPQMNIKIVKGEIVKFASLVGIGNFSCTFPKSGPATYSFDMVNVGAPDVDDLGAVS